MIIAKLMGGLGNQMFQYAFARSLAIKHGVEFKLDTTLLYDNTLGEKFTVRSLGLSHFNTKLNIASNTEIENYRKGKLFKILDLFYLNLSLKFNKLYIREPFFRFYQKALSAPKDSYLDGYWQSEKYFNEIRKELLNDFTVVSELSPETKKLAERIKSEEAVSIHVRRGDYLSITENQAIYSICNEGYYFSAMKKIAEINKEVVFYVFSDEPEWFKENINTNYIVHFVTHNTGINSYQDLYLMTLCKHNIIANSSFSWWGAWLNQNSKKVVIAPKNWFIDKKRDTRDLIPKAWIQL